MKNHPDWIVTVKEALQIVGVRSASMQRLEQLARLPDIPNRRGYSSEELHQLISALKKAIAHHPLGHPAAPR